MLVIDPIRAYENQVHHDSIYVDNIETSRGKFCNGFQIHPRDAADSPSYNITWKFGRNIFQG